MRNRNATTVGSLRTLVGAVFGVLLCSGAASAGTLVVPCSVVSSPAELNASITCSQFDASGGNTLNSISILISGEISGSITLSNSPGAAGSNTGTATVQSDFFVGALSGFSFLNPLVSASFTAGPVTLAPGATQIFTMLSGSDNNTITNNTVFAPYTGVGSFLIPVQTLTGLLISGGGGQFGGNQSTTAEATAEVTYDFTAPNGVEVPEPTTLALLGSGLLGIALRSRRRRES